MNTTTATTKTSTDSSKPKKSRAGWLFVLVAVVVMVVIATTEKRVSVPWLTDYKAAVEKARASNKPLLLVFMGIENNSMWTKRDCFSNKEFVTFVEAFVPVYLEANQNRSLVEKYQIGQYPTFIVSWAEGTTQATIPVAHVVPSVLIPKLQRGLTEIGPAPQP